MLWQGLLDLVRSGLPAMGPVVAVAWRPGGRAGLHWTVGYAACGWLAGYASSKVIGKLLTPKEAMLPAENVAPRVEAPTSTPTTGETLGSMGGKASAISGLGPAPVPAPPMGDGQVIDISTGSARRNPPAEVPEQPANVDISAFGKE